MTRSVFDKAVFEVRRLLSAADVAGVPRERLAYAVTRGEYDILRTRIVTNGLCYQEAQCSYTPDSIRLMGVPVVELP